MKKIHFNETPLFCASFYGHDEVGKNYFSQFLELILASEVGELCF